MWVGRVGVLFGWECVLCAALEYILLPPLPLLHSDLVLSQQSLPPSRHALDLLCCVCANVDGVPLQTSVRWIWCVRYCWCLAGHWVRVDGWCLCRWDRVWVVSCCVVLCVSFVFGFCGFLHLIRIMVSVEM